MQQNAEMIWAWEARHSGPPKTLARSHLRAWIHVRYMLPHAGKELTMNRY
jgi:hypothetical protein